MRRAQLFGLSILAVTAAAAVSWDYLGRSRQPVTFVLPFARDVTLAEGTAGTINHAASLMLRNPDYRAVVEGHTGTLGDAEANLSLSQRRAEVVDDALTEAGVPADRIELLAIGEAAPLDMADDESEAAYQRRLGRVELTLVPE